MEAIHKNYDAVFKDAMTLFKDKTLEFLGLHGIAPIAEPLSTEIIRVEVSSEFLDLTFGLRDGRGLHLEEEVNLSYNDMLRFGIYHLELSRVYKREFITVIFVKEPTVIEEIKTEQFIFKPIIVQCSRIGADEVLNRLRKGIRDGKQINELELIYLPLFNSDKYSPTELFKESTSLINALKAEDSVKRKISALSVVLASKVVKKSVLEKYVEELRNMSNVIIEVFEEYGEKIGMEKGLEKGKKIGLEEGQRIGEERGRKLKEAETTLKMINKGYSSKDILYLTGISHERLNEIAGYEVV